MTHQIVIATNRDQPGRFLFGIFYCCNNFNTHKIYLRYGGMVEFFLFYLSKY